MEGLTYEERVERNGKAILKEKRYIKKIKNDVDEKLYDLLLVHLIDVHEKVKPYGIYNYNKGEKELNGSELVELLDRAIIDLKENINYYTKMRNYRCILILCNCILKYQIKRQDIKDLKMEIVQDYIHSEESLGELIPLNYQINELRITYDASYVQYLVSYFLIRNLFHKALYCLKALEMIEPDHDDLDHWRQQINDYLPNKSPEEMSFYKPKDESLCLDSNVVIEWLKFKANLAGKSDKKYFLPLKYGKDNRLIITPSVIEEVEAYLDFRCSQLYKKFGKSNRKKAEEITNNLKNAWESIVSKHRGPDVEVSDELITSIKNFYKDYIFILEEILDSKIKHKMVSYKLRKLAQRKNLLPEKGDMKLLAECIYFSEDRETSILSKDKDFTLFAGEIFKTFGIKVYRA